MTINVIQVNAFDLGLSDLDEYLPCMRIKEEIGKFSTEVDVAAIEINLEKCWIDYSFSYLYLDEALKILIGSRFHDKKTLKIIVGVNLGEAHFMAALLFPLSTIIATKAEAGPLGLLGEVKKLCAENNLNIIVVSRLQGNGTRDETIFTFGDAPGVQHE